MNSLTLILRELYNDESGLVLSAEAVTVGAVGVMGAVVGAQAISSSIDSELKEASQSIRSLDQSYIYAGHRGCRAWTAGSYYIQPSNAESAGEINADAEPELRAIQKRIDDERKAFAQPPASVKKRVEPSPTPTIAPTVQEVRPNQIPVPEKQAEPGQKPDGPTPLNPQ